MYPVPDWRRLRYRALISLQAPLLLQASAAAAAPKGSWCLLEPPAQPPRLSISTALEQRTNRERLLSFLLHRGEEEMEVQREDQEFFSAEVGALRIHTHAIAPHPKLPFGHLSSRNPLTAHPADALGCSS